MDHRRGGENDGNSKKERSNIENVETHFENAENEDPKTMLRPLQPARSEIHTPGREQTQILFRRQRSNSKLLNVELHVEGVPASILSSTLSFAAEKSVQEANELADATE